MGQPGIPAPETYPAQKLDLLVCAAGELWNSTGGQDPHDVLSVPQREVLDLAAVQHAQDVGYPPEKLALLVRSAGELWNSTGGQHPHDALSPEKREALDLAADVYRAELDREMGGDGDVEVTARPLPAPDVHAPLSVLNRTGRGLRSMTICSCGHTPARAPQHMNAMFASHMAHRRKLNLPRADYSTEVFGEGPWAGWTWNEWYAQFGGSDIDPYTGKAPASDRPAAAEPARLEARFAEAAVLDVDLAGRADGLRARRDGEDEPGRDENESGVQNSDGEQP